MAVRAIGRRDEIVGRNLRLIADNLRRLEAFVESQCDLLDLNRPPAGTMALVRQRTGMTSTEFY